VLVSARKFPEHGVTAPKELPDVAPLDKATQPPQTLELPVRSEAADAA
jgi:hypothetical protein